MQYVLGKDADSKGECVVVVKAGHTRSFLSAGSNSLELVKTLAIRTNYVKLVFNLFAFLLVRSG